MKTLAFIISFVSLTAFAGADKPALPRNADRIVVAADGSGDFTSVQAAVDFAEAHREKPVVIFIRKGHYEERVRVGRDKPHVHLVGEDRKGTVLAFTNNEKLNSGWIQRSVLGVEADDFVLENLTVQNTTPYRGSQAEAVSVNAASVRPAKRGFSQLSGYAEPERKRLGARLLHRGRCRLRVGLRHGGIRALRAAHDARWLHRPGAQLRVARRLRFHRLQADRGARSEESLAGAHRYRALSGEPCGIHSMRDGAAHSPGRLANHGTGERRAAVRGILEHRSGRQASRRERA